MKETERRIAEAVKALIEGAKVEVRDVRKNNGVILRQLQISKGERIQPSLTIDGYIGQAEAGRDIEEIAQEIVESYNRSVEFAKGFNFDFSRENVLKHTKARLINAENNQEMLKDVPHKPFLDLAIIYRCYLDDKSSFVITNKYMDNFGTNPMELWRAAEKNTEQYDCMNVSEIIRRQTGVYVPDEPMYVLTNKARCCGSSVMMFTEYFRELATRFNSDLYILPSSIHKVIAIPTSEIPTSEVGDVEGLRTLVGAVNSNDVEEQEVLSSSVYLYSLDTDEISIA